jgi:hypothetical protein
MVLRRLIETPGLPDKWLQVFSPNPKNLPGSVEVRISGDYYWAVLDTESKQKGRSSMESSAQFRRDETWTPTEKKLARIAFDNAFERQCTAITQEARRMLETTSAPSDIFRVQEYLTEQRRTVERLYDYRYSRLLGVFGRLLSDGWLREGDLQGLQPDKIAKIRREASCFS